MATWEVRCKRDVGRGRACHEVYGCFYKRAENKIAVGEPSVCMWPQPKRISLRTEKKKVEERSFI